MAILAVLVAVFLGGCFSSDAKKTENIALRKLRINIYVKQLDFGTLEIKSDTAKNSTIVTPEYFQEVAVLPVGATQKITMYRLSNLIIDCRENIKITPTLNYNVINVKGTEDTDSDDKEELDEGHPREITLLGNKGVIIDKAKSQVEKIKLYSGNVLKEEIIPEYNKDGLYYIEERNYSPYNIQFVSNIEIQPQQETQLIKLLPYVSDKTKYEYEYITNSGGTHSSTGVFLFWHYINTMGKI
jgi:hypothetical protein